ncbi:MAG: type II toxin-antitoxin system RelE/ParE family toxin [Candidatus Electrothrix sp. ATG1]|nr:type II toxin-antitoxin system RelE/ParE family toxin [Candidatus Electrothrix sp. ATG1]
MSDTVHPGIGRPGRVAGTGKLVVSGVPYIIPYFEEDGGDIMLRIMHTSMKLLEPF